jgi:RimJ/RimL family protein N-acetyltransferase
MSDPVRLREVREEDLPVFFAHQADEEAAAMAGFPSRDRGAFMAHWSKLMGDETVGKRTVLVGETVAGNVVAFDHEGRREVGYWIGREHWGRGVATRALEAFLAIEERRPLYAVIAPQNVASARVLHKCGFTVCAGELPPAALDGEGAGDVTFVLQTTG